MLRSLSEKHREFRSAYQTAHYNHADEGVHAVHLQYLNIAAALAAYAPEYIEALEQVA